MAKKKKSFADALNAQIANEFAASQSYVAMAVYYDSETLPRLAAFFYRQALEEREHAMMMTQFLLDTGSEARIPGVKAPQAGFTDAADAVRRALTQEEKVSDDIFALVHLAREVGDYRAEQFMQWFVKEQVEEVSLMGDLLKTVERSKDNLMLVEEYISREGIGAEGEDPTAPPVAGGG